SAKGNPHAVRVHELASGKQVADFRHPRGDVTCVALSPEGKRALSASKAGVQFWDVQAGTGTAILDGARVTSAEFSPDRKFLLVGDVLGALRLLSAETGAEVRTFEAKHTSGVTSVAFSADSKRVASGSGDRTVRTHDVATGKQI